MSENTHSPNAFESNEALAASMQLIATANTGIPLVEWCAFCREINRLCNSEASLTTTIASQESRIEALTKALEGLHKTGCEVNRSRESGTHWVYFTASLINARTALAAKEGDA